MKPSTDGWPLMALAIWGSALPLLFLLVVPRAGIARAVLIALALLSGIVTICWIVCTASRTRKTVNADERHLRRQ